FFDVFAPPPLTVAQFQAVVAAAFGSQAAAVEALYPVSSDADAKSAYDTLMTDFLSRCPTREFARLATAHGTRDFYLYSYEAGRAFHTDDLLALFTVSNLAPGTPLPSPGFQALMQGYWTRFAATGNPNSTQAPAWPKYAADTDQHLA